MIKLNKKITVVIVCILLIIAVFFVVYLTADNKTVKKSITSEKYETASVTASMFTASCMSDTTLSKNEDFSIVDPKDGGARADRGRHGRPPAGGRPRADGGGLRSPLPRQAQAHEIGRAHV